MADQNTVVCLGIKNPHSCRDLPQLAFLFFSFSLVSPLTTSYLILSRHLSTSHSLHFDLDFPSLRLDSTSTVLLFNFDFTSTSLRPRLLFTSTTSTSLPFPSLRLLDFDSTSQSLSHVDFIARQVSCLRFCSDKITSGVAVANRARHSHTLLTIAVLRVMSTSTQLVSYAVVTNALLIDSADA